MHEPSVHDRGFAFVQAANAAATTINITPANFMRRILENVVEAVSWESAVAARSMNMGCSSAMPPDGCVGGRTGCRSDGPRARCYMAGVMRLLLAVMLALAVPAVAHADDDSMGQPRGRSGFWTNPNPAVGGSYRWRLLAVGVGLAVLTGGGMLVLVRRANAARAAGTAKPTRRR